MTFQYFSKPLAVTPSDATNFAQGDAEALWIGVAGTISFIPADPTLAAPAAVATTVPAGLFPVRVRRVNATGTAATGILALR